MGGARQHTGSPWRCNAAIEHACADFQNPFDFTHHTPSLASAKGKVVAIPGRATFAAVISLDSALQPARLRWASGRVLNCETVRCRSSGTVSHPIGMKEHA
jgi:hypothetical protein